MVAWKRVGIVMAGGSGERFWPVSQPDCPKQFLRLAHPEKSLIVQSFERAARLGEAFVATNARFAALSAEACGTDPAHVFAEPDKRNTLGCLVWVAGSLMARFPDHRVTLAVLTADHRIEPVEAFVRCAERAMEAAEDTGGVSVIGIRPERAETGYGYIEAVSADAPVSPVSRFREKPDLATATEFVRDPRYSWNSGMFFLTLPSLLAELERQQPVAFTAAHDIARALANGDQPAAESAFRRVHSNSFDKAVMEHAAKVSVVRAEFEWDDLGSWDALRRSVPPDGAGNVAVGEAQFLDSASNSVYVDGSTQKVSLLGVTGMVVVVTPDAVLVVPESRAQEVKRLVGS